MEKSMISLCLLGGLAIGNGFAQTPSKPNILGTDIHIYTGNPSVLGGISF